MKKLFKFTAVFIIFLALFATTLQLMFPLPDISKRQPSKSLDIDFNTELGKVLEQGRASHPNKTGVIPLVEGHDALNSRLYLTNTAQRSIDVQYYIWHDDISGKLLLHALYKASQRGVKVRLLLDDNGIHGLDSTLTALNALANFEVRIFNPSMIRKPKILGYSFDFFRMNRRMHNKAFIFDGAAAIIGGRNIGNEYFQVGEEQFFIDLDVLGVGEIVSKTAKAFDQYWNSQSSYEIDSFIKDVGDLSPFISSVALAKTGPEAVKLNESAKNSAERLINENITLEWTTVELAYDDPIKGLGKAKKDQLMIGQMVAMVGEVKSKLDLVSAYFIPGNKGQDYFSNLAKDGKQVRILTNAMATTDVIMVHAGYSKYRRKLLKAGVNLYELKRHDDFLKDKKIAFGISSASLHAKTFAVDENRIFIGSFNFDPRSVNLNCEMGFLIHSPSLARKLTASFDESVSKVSYQPKLTPNDKMVWNEELKNGETTTYQEEPEATWLQQIMIVIVGLLPVEWLL